MARVEKASRVIDLLGKMEQLGPSAYDQVQLTELFTRIERLLTGNEDLSALLASINLKKVSPQVILTALRAGAPASHAIPNWAGYVESAKAELLERGLNAEKLLRGL